MQLHRGKGSVAVKLNLIQMQIKKFRVFSNPDRATVKELKDRMRLRSGRLPAPGLTFYYVSQEILITWPAWYVAMVSVSAYGSHYSIGQQTITKNTSTWDHNILSALLNN